MATESGNTIFTIRCNDYGVREELIQTYSDEGFQLVSEAQGMVAVGHGINVVSMPMIHLTFTRVDSVENLAGRVSNFPQDSREGGG